MDKLEGPRVTEHLTLRAEQEKKPYVRPELTVHGTVQDMTGGLTSIGGDNNHSGTSDVALKENFVSPDPAAILEALATLPITTWNYRSDDPSVRHIGPMAQDFASTFQVGPDNKVIFQVDGDGVALAAIQALRVQLREAEAVIARLSREMARLSNADEVDSN